MDGAQAADVSEQDIKASYLLNFIRFTEWPAETFASSNAPISVAIIGKDPFGSKIDAIFEGEKAGGRPLVLRRAARLEDAGDSHVVFIPAGEAVEAAAFRGRPVLLVGDGRDFIRDGGMVRFAVEKGRVVFDIQRTTTEKAGLKINSRLLRLARKVEGTGD